MNRKFGALLLVVTSVGLAPLAGCSATPERNVTVGQELQDLEEARDEGLVTENEYQKQRQEILNR